MHRVVLAQIDSVQAGPAKTSAPGFRDFQFDYVTLLSSSTTSFSFDYDVMPLTVAENPAFFGIRAGIDYLQSSGISGSSNGSPFSDYNLLVRLTSKIQHSRVDIYTGYSYRTSPDEGFSGAQFKLGLEFKYLFAHDTFGFIMKLCAVRGAPSALGCAGVGLVCNLDF
jgi:hypothetical protein